MANLIIVKSCIRLGPRRGSKRWFTTNTDAGRQSIEIRAKLQLGDMLPAPRPRRDPSSSFLVFEALVVYISK